MTNTDKIPERTAGGPEALKSIERILAVIGEWSARQ